jgi:hypothetical protein
MCRATMTIGAPSGAGGAREYRGGPPPPVRYPPSSIPAFLVNFYEKALFVKTDVAVAPCGRVQLLSALRALCFYSHFQ